MTTKHLLYSTLRQMSCFLLLIFVCLFSACDQRKQVELVSTKNTSTESNWQLLWSDEFEHSGLPDTTKWSYDVGNTCERPMGCGWGNNELQYYTDGVSKNARVEAGKLVIEAHKENISTNKFSSARLVSRSKGSFKYGKMEIRAKLPSGRGTWPAIWMMPQDDVYGGWPRSGEIDIMEHVGYEPDSIFGTPHTLAYHHSIGTQKGGGIKIPTSEDNFHVYSIDWNEDRINWFVDGTQYHTFKKEAGSETWPFDQSFYFILNIAVGGNWGGAKGVDTSIWPQKMLIDYVRVYSQQDTI